MDRYAKLDSQGRLKLLGVKLVAKQITVYIVIINLVE